MSETGILTSLRAKLRTGVQTGVAGRATTSEALQEALAGKRSAAEAQLADAEGTHRRAALDVEKGVPGAASRKAEAAAAVREAEENLRDVMGAQIEADAEMREIERNRRHAEERAHGLKAQAAAVRCEELAREGAAVIASFTEWYAKYRPARLELHGLAEGAPWLRGSVRMISCEALVTQEILRSAPIDPNSTTQQLITPPGTDPASAFQVKMAGFQPLTVIGSDELEAIRVKNEKAEKARAKEARR